MIDLFKSYISPEAKDLVMSVLDSGNAGGVDLVAQLEKVIAEDLGCKYIVATNSCTSALYLACKLLGRRILRTSCFTHPATYFAIEEAGSEVRYEDINRHNYCGGSDVAVHYGGVAIHDAPIQDAAHALWSKYEFDSKRYVGNSDNLVCFSLQGGKILNTGDGGFIATNNREYAEKLRLMIFFGIDRNGLERKKYMLNYPMFCSLKYHMNNLQAAIGIGNWKHKKEILAKYKYNHDYYNSHIWSPGKITFWVNGNYSNNYLYNIEVDDNMKFIDYMTSNGIRCGIFYKPEGNFATANEVFKKTVSIPNHYFLTDSELEYVCQIINRY